MKRRSFLAAASATALGSAVLSKAPRAFAQKKRYRWRLALTVPKTLPIWGEGMERFAERLEKLSSGQIRIRVYGAGELVPGLGTFDSVSKGEIELGSSASYYWLGKVPCSPFFASVPFGMNTDGNLSWIRDGGGQELWDKAMAPHNIKCLPCGATGPQMMGWFNKELNTPEDLKGLKIRVPGLAGKVYAKAGASPVLLPGGEIFTSLTTGVIDAVEWVGPYHDYLMGFHKAAQYYYGPSWHEPGSLLELTMHKPTWDSLSEELKLMIETAAYETTVWMRTTWESKNAEYLAKLRAEGKVKVRDLPDAVINYLSEKSSEVMREIRSADALSKEVFASYDAFMKRYQPYQILARNLKTGW